MMRIATTIACAGVMMPSGTMTAQSEVTCNRGTIAVLLSPDNAWVALVREGDCGDGAFATASTDVVQLVPREALDAVSLAQSPDEAEHDNDVLVVDNYGHFEQRPVLKWLSPRKLQLTIPNISGVGLHKSSYRDVAIVLKYDPDDPIARQQWRKERSLGKSP